MCNSILWECVKSDRVKTTHIVNFGIETRKEKKRKTNLSEKRSGMEKEEKRKQ